jgi:outer membrane protein OmpA-like peptidoglycan-associated protein
MAMTVMGQQPSTDDLSLRQLKKFAENAERVGDEYTAIYFYEAYYNKRKTNNNVNYRLAELYRSTRNYEKAKELYEKVVIRAGKKYLKARFYYARMLKATGEYDLAIEEFTQFRRYYRDEKDYKEYSKLTRLDIEGCEKAKAIIENEQNVSIEQLSSSVNGPHIEFSPIPIDDSTLYYGSLRIDSVVFFNEQNVDTLMPYRKFYMAEKEGLDWIGGKKFPFPFNKEGIHNGNGVFSKDGRHFYFTRCAPNWQNKMICAIYVSEYANGKWQTPVKLPEIINDPSYTSTQPAIGRTAKYDRRVLYFVSDRPEGRGGLDLWYSVYNPRREEWREPKNMGFKINTPGDEMTPFYDHFTRTLYYSSDGQPGIGGLDIFHAMGERRKWTDVQNLGYPLNSSYDDLYFTVSKSRDYGFFSSNRPGKFYINNETCCDDIYYYKWKDFIRLAVEGTVYPMEKDRFGRKKDYSNFDFMNPPDTLAPLSGAIMALYMKDEASEELIFMERDTTSDDGKYHFDLLPERNYQLFMEGFQYFNEEVHLSTEGLNFSYTVEMPPIWVNVLLDKPIVLQDIHYEFNSAELTEKSKSVIDTTIMVLLKEAPEFIVEVGSHTDSVGSAEYNKELSQERAENVVDYIVSQGIDKERLIPRGYGPEKPIAPNYKPDGSDNPQGRERNRRTEFRIVGSLKEPDSLEDEEDFE